MLTVAQAFALALQHHQAGRIAEAEVLYRQILAVQPAHAEAYNNLGSILAGRKQWDDALTAYQQAIQLKPENAEIHNNVGISLMEQRQVDEAVASFRRAIQLQPGHAKAHCNLGHALRDRGQLEEAVAVCRRAVELDPTMPEAHNNLGNVLQDQRRFTEATSAYQRAIYLRPSYAAAHSNLGDALRYQGSLDQAAAELRVALQLDTGLAEAWGNLGNALKDRGELEEAAIAYRRALQIRADNAKIHSNLIYLLYFGPTPDETPVIEEQRRWVRQFCDPLKRHIVCHANRRYSERRLRVGYVSLDFRDHVVGSNLIPLFKHHDHGSFHITCYSGCVQRDKFTEQFQQYADKWHDTAGMDDETLAETIHQDGVDILVDLTQHMAGNRLTMFARKPAPVQVSFAGYPDSTGVDTIECRVSDWWLECGTSGAEASAEIEWKVNREVPHERVYLIDSFWCYDPCGMEMAVKALPATEDGFITFGSLNNFCKVNDPLLKLWARVLREVPESRLVMLSGLGSHRQRTIDFLEKEGVAAPRVEFVEPRPSKEYLELYHRLDVVLDTFPYNGHTTSLDALWMGVPVVSLCGERPVSRAGLSQLSNLGLPEWVAHSEDQYIEIATRLVCDLPRLEELRRTLRARMEASVLMDAPRFARNIEAAYRAMWRHWCARTPA